MRFTRHRRVPIILAALFVMAAGRDASAFGQSALTVKITSPLGRLGTSGKVRIVAQIHDAPDSSLGPVRFFVDGVLLGEDTDGVPYAVEWFDENPYERRELAVEVEDSAGHAARDELVLQPFELTEITSVDRVLLEASVYDKKGRFVDGLERSSFVVKEDGVVQDIDVVSHETVPTTFALLIDSSQSMNRRIDFVRDAAGRLISFLRPKDRVMVAPFSRGLGAVTGPTDDRKTVLEALEHIHSAGGTAILDSLVEVVKKLPDDPLIRSAVVLITDGYDENSVTPFEDALAAVKAARATVYVVAIGGIAGISLNGERLLKQIALESGGQIFFPPREENLVAVHDRLSNDAQNRYLLTYIPSNQRVDGKWREVTLTTTPEYRVRTRAGYKAPDPPPVRPELEFTITDSEERYVDVTIDDLMVVEDGVEQDVQVFHEALEPVSIVLALDASGSMVKSADVVVEAAREFVAALRPEDSLAPMLFADRPVFAHDLTTDRDEALKAIESYKAAGGTALYDALWDSLTRLKRIRGRRTVVVLTDGRDENNAGTAAGSLRTFDEVSKLVKETDASIYAIGLGAKVNREALDELARLSGGHTYFPLDVTELQEEYGRVIENLRRRFVLSYTSTNTARDGSWREVQIRSRTSDIVFTSRGGYLAPDR